MYFSMKHFKAKEKMLVIFMNFFNIEKLKKKIVFFFLPQSSLLPPPLASAELDALWTYKRAINGLKI